MKKFLKTLIKLSAVGAIFFTGAPFFSVIVTAYLATKAVDILGSVVEFVRQRRVSARARVNDDELRKIVKIHRENTRKKFFINDKEKPHWNLDVLPLDMYPQNGMRSSKAVFNCAGVPGVVTGKFLGENLFGRQKVEFSITIDDQARAQMMADYIKENGLIGTTVKRLDERNFEIVSDNAVDISTIVKEFYQPHTMTVRRELRTTNQYRVSGCKSFEEAKAKFEAERFRYRPENTYFSYQDTVNGVADQPYVNGLQIYAEHLPVGDYIINETSTDVYSRDVTFNGGLDRTEESLRSVASDMFKPEKGGNLTFSREHDLVEDQCKGPVLSDALENERTRRYFWHKNEMVDVRSLADGERTNASMYVKFDSLDELRRVVSGESSIDGQLVYLDSNKMEAKEGGFLLSVPLDGNLLKRLHCINGGTDETADQLKGMGVTSAEVESSCILHDMDKSGSTVVQVFGNVDFSNALVNGVPVAQLNERIDDMVSEGKADQLESRRQAESWLRDASMIHSIHMDIDVKNQNLVITSTCGTYGNQSTQVETVKLDDEQLDNMMSRGYPSKTELKDLLMKCHPDYFETYRQPGTNDKGLYLNPVKDFIDGVKPRLAADVQKESKEEKKRIQEDVKQKKSSKKIQKNSAKIC